MASIDLLSELFHDIGSQLTADEVTQLRDLLRNRKTGINARDLEKCTTAEAIFISLENQGFLKKNNLELLDKLLTVVGRKALVERIYRYYETVPHTSGYQEVTQVPRETPEPIPTPISESGNGIPSSPEPKQTRQEDKKERSCKKIFVFFSWSWFQKECEDSTSFINRQIAINLSHSYKDTIKIYSTALTATEEEIKDAAEYNVTLIKPDTQISHKVSKRIFQFQRYCLEYLKKLSPSNRVDFFVGHANSDEYDTLELAASIQRGEFPESCLITIVHDIAEKHHQDFEEYLSYSTLIFALGPKLCRSVNGQLIKLKKKPPLEMFIPTPDSIYKQVDIPEPMIGDFFPLFDIITIGNYSTKKTREMCGIVASAMGKVATDLGKDIKWEICGAGNNEDFIHYLRDEAKSTCLTIIPDSSGTERISPNLFSKFGLMVNNDECSFSVSMINGIGAGLPVLLNSRSGLSEIIEEDDELCVFHENSTVDPHFELELSVDEWKCKMKRALKKQKATYKRGQMMKKIVWERKNNNNQHEMFYRRCLDVL